MQEKHVCIDHLCNQLPNSVPGTKYCIINVCWHTHTQTPKSQPYPVVFFMELLKIVCSTDRSSDLIPSYVILNRRKIIYKKRSLYKQLSSYRKPVIFPLKAPGNVRGIFYLSLFKIAWMHTLFISFLTYSWTFLQEIPWPEAQRDRGKQMGKKGRVFKVKCFLLVVEDAYLTPNDQRLLPLCYQVVFLWRSISYYLLLNFPRLYYLCLEKISSFPFIEKLCPTNCNCNLIYKV